MNSAALAQQGKDVPDVPTEDARHSIGMDLKEIVTDLWKYRELLCQLTVRDLRLRYKQAVMGVGWAIFMPALVVLAGILVKYAMAHLTGKPLDTRSIVATAVKAIPWAFFIGAIGFATNSLTSNIRLVTKLYFPREVFPLSATLTQAVDSSIGAGVLLLVLPWLGVRLSLTLLWAPVLALLLFLFTVAVALFLSCANLFFRDVKYIVHVLLMFGIFFTPVFFEPAMFGSLGSQLMMLNPLSAILEGLRLSIVANHNLLIPLSTVSASGQEILLWSPWYLLYSVFWAIAGLLGISLLFHRLEFVFAEYI